MKIVRIFQPIEESAITYLGSKGYMDYREIRKR